MSLNNNCQRCGEKETYKHLLWSCSEARKIWNIFNTFIIRIPLNQQANEYSEIFRIERLAVISIIKIRMIQAMIQVERPTGWTIENIERIARDFKNIELYNSAASCNTLKVKKV